MGILSLIVALVAIGSVISALLPAHKVKFGPQEVIYKGDATKAEATALGTKLQEDGYFDGKQSATVTLEKSKSDGTVISYTVLDGQESKPESVESMECTSRRVVSAVGGAPFTFRMVNPQDKELLKRSIANIGIATVGKIDVICEGSATDAQAMALCKALNDEKYTASTSQVSVFLDQSPDKKITIKFVVASADSAKKPAVIDKFETDARAVAPSVGGLPLTMKLISPDFIELKSETIK